MFNYIKRYRQKSDFKRERIKIKVQKSYLKVNYYMEDMSFNCNSKGE